MNLSLFLVSQDILKRCICFANNSPLLFIRSSVTGITVRIFLLGDLSLAFCQVKYGFALFYIIKIGPLQPLQPYNSIHPRSAWTRLCEQLDLAVDDLQKSLPTETILCFYNSMILKQFRYSNKIITPQEIRFSYFTFKNTFNWKILFISCFANFCLNKEGQQRILVQPLHFHTV